jgi:hypothetical protein
MTDFSAYITAQQVTRATVLSARPNAPIHPDDVPMAHRTGVVAARLRLSGWLRRLADVVQPVYSGTTWSLPATR